MRRALGYSFLLVAALTTVASARPVDQSASRQAEIPALNLDASSQGYAKTGIGQSPANHCVVSDTVEYGGTRWDSDSLRWEAIRDSVWTFDTGVGSAYGATGPNKPAGYHTQMEGWVGIDQTLNPLPYFRRSTLCVITGSFSLYAGVSLSEANALCYAAGQGYGNSWNMEVRKTYAVGATGNAVLAYDYAADTEPGFDYAYARIDTSGDGSDPDVDLAVYTGASSGSESINLVRGSSLRSDAGNVVIKFVVNSDGSYSDEDGLYPTVCGAISIDNIVLTGSIVDNTTFEVNSNGWTATVPTTGTGDFSNIVNRNTDLPPPVTFCACSVTDSVLVFYDELLGHPDDQDNIVASPWIDLKAGGDNGRPGKLMLYSVYAEMPLANYVFVQLRARWYPSTCTATGLVYTTPFRDQNTIFYYGEAPYCNAPGTDQLRDYSAVIETAAEQVQLGIGMISLCATAPFGPPCTGVSNTTPWLDKISLGVFGSNTAPNVTVLTFDWLQDNFATDGTLNPGSPGRLDANTIKNGSTPGPGTILRDTLCARGDGGNTEVRLVFKIDPGPFAAAGIATQVGRWTSEAGTIGAGWYSARMDTAEQGGLIALPMGYMTTFHESDPGFIAGFGGDRGGDPNDPNHLENEIIPDDILTPGSRVDYFIAARYLPTDPRNPGNHCQWFTVPDTTQRFAEIEILPSSTAADSSWNCTLYVDHHHDRSAFDHTLEEAGLTASLGVGGNNKEGTRYDRFDNQTPSSGQLSFGRPIETIYGASIIQAFAYKNIVWHGGTLSSLVLTDEDANIVGPWLTLRGVGTNRFWGSGSGLARSMNVSGEPSTINFMRNVLGALNTCNTIRDVNCPTGTVLDSTYCLPTSAVAGSHFTTTIGTNARGNGCPDLESFDLLNTNSSVLTARGQLNYVKTGVNRAYASVTNWNTLDVDYKTVLDGMAVGRLRTTPASPNNPALCTVTTASTTRTDNVLDWFATAANCKLPVGLSDVPGFEAPKPPQFRAALGNAYPNPMNPTTRIQFTNGTENGKVTLQIFDVTGRLVKNLVDGKMAAGVHEVTWDGTTEGGSTAPSGMYFYKMTGDNGNFTSSKKLVMMK